MDSTVIERRRELRTRLPVRLIERLRTEAIQARRSITAQLQVLLEDRYCQEDVSRET